MFDFKQWISEKEFALHRIETLVFLLVSAGILLMDSILNSKFNNEFDTIAQVISFNLM